jgi:hypothetical protein
VDIHLPLFLNSYLVLVLNHYYQIDQTFLVLILVQLYQDLI